ncbi:MAG: helix-turn-helix transcriptional regulator [Pseudomonadota bacterium]
MNFHERLESIISDSPYSLNELSKRIGKAAPYLSNMLRQRSEPSATTLMRLAHALHTTPNALCGLDDGIIIQPDEQDENNPGERAGRVLTREAQKRKAEAFWNGQTPSITDVVKWWRVNDGLLTDFDLIKPMVDLYEVPDADTTVPLISSMGPESLASRSFKISDAAKMRRILRDLDRDYMLQLVTAQADTRPDDPNISHQRINVQVPASNLVLDFEYIRLYLRVRDARGGKYILNFSQPIW